jgi:hypothetical protein
LRAETAGQSRGGDRVPHVRDPQRRNGHRLSNGKDEASPRYGEGSGCGRVRGGPSRNRTVDLSCERLVATAISLRGAAVPPRGSAARKRFASRLWCLREGVRWMVRIDESLERRLHDRTDSPAISPSSQRRALASASSSRARPRRAWAGATLLLRAGRRSRLAAAGGSRPRQIEPLRLGIVRNGKRDFEPARPNHDFHQALVNELALAQVLIRTLVRLPEGLGDDRDEASGYSDGRRPAAGGEVYPGRANGRSAKTSQIRKSGMSLRRRTSGTDRILGS